MRGQLPPEILELWPEETELVGVLNKKGERLHPFPAMQSTRVKGVTQQLRHVVASRDIAIWEMDAVTPAGCPEPLPAHPGLADVPPGQAGAETPGGLPRDGARGTGVSAVSGVARQLGQTERSSCRSTVVSMTWARDGNTFSTSTRWVSVSGSATPSDRTRTR